LVPQQAKGELGGLILGERYLTVTFRFKRDEGEVKGKIAWDCNEKSLDGFSPSTGWIRVDLTKLFFTHRVYEIKRRRLQQKASKKPSLRRVLAKYSKRERNRAKDYIAQNPVAMRLKLKPTAQNKLIFPQRGITSWLEWVAVADEGLEGGSG
jgi:hypothetical protein